MKYLGGKTRVANRIGAKILELSDGRTEYLEPFLGSAAVFVAVCDHFDSATGADSMPDLILMWQAARAGWVPPGDVSEDEYRHLREQPPSALRGFVGFTCSFSGKWFGGFARGGVSPKGQRDYAGAGKRSVLRRAALMGKATILCRDYREWEIGPNHVVYCDPPYADTTGYAGCDPFDTGEFWQTAERWSATGALVLVSEFVAPGGWEPVLTIKRQLAVMGTRTDRAPVADCLWRFVGET